MSPQSVRPLPRPSFAAPSPGHDLAADRLYAWLCLLVLVAGALAVCSLRRGRVGAAMTALRSSEAATAAMGFSVTWTKLRGFALSGLLAGAAGGLFAGLIESASGRPFDTTRSITLLAYAVIAGVGNVPGAIVGGALVTLSTVSVSSGGGVASGRSADLLTMATGVVLVAVLLLAPTGVTGIASRLRDRLGRRTPPTAPASNLSAPHARRVPERQAV